MATDDVALLGGSAIELVGAEMTRRAASDVFKEAGIGPDDVQVVECHDCFSANEMYVPVIPECRLCPSRSCVYPFPECRLYPSHNFVCIPAFYEEIRFMSLRYHHEFLFLLRGVVEYYYSLQSFASIDGRVCIDAMGLSPKGKAHELVANGDITFGGKYLINPSGGLISKGHPIGATGLAQASELVTLNNPS